ncbi:MAG: FAD-binding oxidoreductase [Planctomycetes bacterium]|nr:FAD-binding oxidoreductase [Planctomycetota bacterium]
MKPRALVIGAGIVGAACAAELARAGFAVVVLEAAHPSAGATACGMGHVVAMDDSEAQLELTRTSRSLWEELLPELPENIEATRAGTLWVAADDEELAAVHAKHAYYLTRGVNAEIHDQHSLRSLEPHLAPDLIGALRVPDDLVVYPPCAAAWLLALSGAELRVGLAVERAEARRVLLHGGVALEGDLVVVAAGEHSLPLVSPALPLHGIKPRKGHLVITDRAPGFAQHQIVELGYLKSAHSHDGSSVAFNLQPRPNGQVLLGSSRQYDRTSDEVEPAMLRRMLERAFRYMPKLRALPAIRAWTGRRAATHDHLPLIGKVGAEGPWLAAGHEGLGITTSLGTARLLSSLIAGTTPPFDPRPFDPQRLCAEASHG